MKYASIRIEGGIFSSDILDKIEKGDISAQLAKDFGLDSKSKVKDEIVKAWADAQEIWRVFKRQADKTGTAATGASETRKYWIIPLLGLLGYEAEVSRAEIINGKSYAISHRATNLDGLPIHVMGFNDSLDKKRAEGGPRMSPHALVQEYLNMTEHLYALVTNGYQLRLLRDASRLVKLSYLEFDLRMMMEEEHFSDFALLFRLLHASRMPIKVDAGAESIIEKYHQDALDSGSRIREGLSRAVEKSLLALGNGFLEHHRNESLRNAIVEQDVKPSNFYQYLLRLIYRFLFLMVIEERNLIFDKSVNKEKRGLYYNFYSINRLRKLCERPLLQEASASDAWLGLKGTFRLFESEDIGSKLEICPLAGDLFGYAALGPLNECHLRNEILLECLRNLSIFVNPNTGHATRVNYGSLNTEEFGSVYEGLLEYEPDISKLNGRYRFSFKKGDERSTSGSHYTPDELVKPLIDHSLIYVIEKKLKEPDKEKALLSIRVCDVACGSGHILLNAARVIGTELGRVRSGEDQPSPSILRQGIRDAIHNCIYGVDKNPLAVELCKVALWLEAHNPGQPLSFLDHHIKCGDAIVGLGSKEELEQGIPDEAFKRLPEDDKTIASKFAKRNKAERKIRQTPLSFKEALDENLRGYTNQLRDFNKLPEKTIKDIEKKKKKYEELSASTDGWRLRNLADIQVAQFFIPKTKENADKLITDEEFREHLNARKPLQGLKVGTAMATSVQKHFFHWFLEFPEVFNGGGFDCILGNPPYLGGQALSGSFGYSFCEYVKWAYAPAGLSDLVVFFLRRIFNLLKTGASTSIITTNSIRDGDVRKDGLEQIVADGGVINMAFRGIKWPGRANLYISLIAIFKGEWKGKLYLDNKEVSYISPHFEDHRDIGEPFELQINKSRIFQGSIFLGDGFILTHDQAKEIVHQDGRNEEVVFPVINGQDINNDPLQMPSRSIINFYNMSMDEASSYAVPFEIIERTVRPFRAKQNRKRNREIWWVYAEHRPGLTSALTSISQCFVAARTTKHLSFSSLPTNYVFTDALYVFCVDRWDLYAIVQSTLHEIWARKYSGSLETRLRYSPSDCFETFPFPVGQWHAPNAQLEKIGQTYHAKRKALMKLLWLGLTDIYNLFHDPSLSPDIIAKVSKKDRATAEWGYDELLQLRETHRELDLVIRDAYGWQDLDLQHEFYEVETLPESDRIRYTISPHVRKEVLKRFLEENHRQAALENNNNEGSTKSSKRGKKKLADKEGDDLFTLAQADASTIPVPTWMDRALIPPNTPRVPLSPNLYRAAVVPHLLYQAGGRVSFDRFRRAYWLLSEPNTLQRYARKALGTVAKTWSESFREQLPKDRFLEHLQGAIGRQLTFYRNNGELWIQLRDPNVTADEHIVFDARLALFVADLWPESEPLAPLSSDEEAVIQKLELVS